VRDGGRVEVLGCDPAEPSTSRALRQRLGIVLQELAVDPFLTVREVLQRQARFYPSPLDLGDVIGIVGLDEKADARVKTLSGGQQRRLDLGLGIVGRPDLIFLDEPTTGFDPSARRSAWELVRSLQHEGATVVLTTHYMEEAEALASRVAVIARGEIVAQGTPSSLGSGDGATVHVEFALPTRVSVEDVPVPGAVVDQAGRVSVETTDELRLLHRLTGWALDNGHELAGLRVQRMTLEDVYIELTRDDGEAMS
jgi:ABC-2 type transport system ATP-binding protein